MIEVVVALAALVVALAAALAYRSRPPSALRIPRMARRILLPFTVARSTRPSWTPRSESHRPKTPCSSPPTCSSSRSSTAKDSPLHEQVAVAIPPFEAIEHRALRCGIPVDARIEKGRTPTHALARLFQVEQFDQVVAPAPANGGGGFTPKDLTWILILPRPSRFYDATDSPPFSEPRLATPHRRSSPPRAPSAQTSSPSAMAAQTSSSSARGECRPRGSGSHAPPTRRQALGDVCSRYRRQLSGVFGHVPRGASGPCLGRSRA